MLEYSDVALFTIPSSKTRKAVRVVQRLGGRGCNQFVRVLGGDGTITAPPRDFFDQAPGEINRTRGKLADHAGDRVVLSPEEVVSVPFPGTGSSYPRPPQSLKHS